jgi:hypothetical protein
MISCSSSLAKSKDYVAELNSIGEKHKQPWVSVIALAFSLSSVSLLWLDGYNTIMLRTKTDSALGLKVWPLFRPL